MPVYFMVGCARIDGLETNFYIIARMSVSVKDSGGIKHLLTDHLGFVQAVTDADGILIGQQRYLVFGGARTDQFAPGRASEYYSNPTAITLEQVDSVDRKGSGSQQRCEI